LTNSHAAVVVVVAVVVAAAVGLAAMRNYPVRRNLNRTHQTDRS